MADISGVLHAFEASLAAPTADATIVTVDSTGVSVDAVNAGDVASFIGSVATPVIIVSGGYRPRWQPVVGTLHATEGPDVASIIGVVGNAGAPATDDEIVMLLLLAA
jgi:hypothetical protein